jgi:hypothetical protein
MGNFSYGDNGPDIADCQANVSDDAWMIGIYIGRSNFDFTGLFFEGDELHIIIELDYMKRYPGSVGTDVVGRTGFGIPNAGPGGGPGYPDIIDFPRNSIWEIKGPAGLGDGTAQVRRYTAASTYVAGTGYSGTSLNHPYLPGWKVVTRQGAPGVILYSVVNPDGVTVPVYDRATEGVRERDQRKVDQLNPAPATVPVPVHGWSPVPSQAIAYGIGWGAAGFAALYALSVLENYKVE